MLTLSVPHTGMAVTMDIGNPHDIHPKQKAEVGYRLALWALASVYGFELTHAGPTYAGMDIEGGSLRLRFEHAEGLTAHGGAPSHFTIAGSDQAFLPAKARIEGQAIVVWSPEIDSPVAVRFAWGATYEPNLLNDAGLPASSFRTDRRKGVTER